MIVSHQFIEPNVLSATELIRNWKKKWPFMGVLAMLPVLERDCVGLLQEVCTAQGVSLTGAIFPALVNHAGFKSDGVLLLCMKMMPTYFLLDGLDTEGGTKLGAALKAMLSGSSGEMVPPGVIFAIFDGILPNVGTLLTQMNALQSTSQNYVGACAGSGTFQPIPCLFDNNHLVQAGALVMLFPATTKVVTHHAYEESESLFRATSAKGNRIVTINNLRAFDVYQNIVGEQFGVILTNENFYEHAVHFPFGLVTATDILVRIPVALGDDGSLIYAGEISPDSMLRLLRAPTLDESRCAVDISKNLNTLNEPVSDCSLLTFYCAGRRLHFGEDAAKELLQIKFETQCSELYGALSLGEIDTPAELEFPRFHNAAVVCLAQPRQR